MISSLNTSDMNPKANGLHVLYTKYARTRLLRGPVKETQPVICMIERSCQEPASGRPGIALGHLGEGDQS